MINRYMYCGYTNSQVNFLKNENVITASCAYYKDMVFLYYESFGDIIPEAFAAASMKPFPDGSFWFKMTDVFHYSTPENEELWTRKIENKQPSFELNFLNYDKIASYIYYHYDHQQGNQYGYDRYGVIFLYKNILVMYHETPYELIEKKEIEGKEHIPCPENWDEIMKPHFKNENNKWEVLKAHYLTVGGNDK